ncbi:hypothetical protein [Flavihumibacter petaseus]|uniref:PsbP C-terminal domain-containing protein n=1 Tax=Flavihumibacter petaseus NBRC 106054 TaxID=1220578 RepID=A0A0E9MXC1_9BACT|nr:hypothetical protein [Flavihumibacter petaseus]GAO41770.1 hypothetical protein FPE01S_01_07840 [Flavihumibacter petaseus NBRC 106054]
MNIKLTFLTFSVFSFTCSVGQIKLEDIKVDTTITGFHFAGDFQGTKVFTKHGSSDLQAVNPTAFSFTIAPGVTSAMAKGQLIQLLNMSKQGGYKISDLTEKDTTMKGNIAYYISYTETDDSNSYKNIVFNAFVIKDNTLILFTGGDLDKGQFIDKFKQTFYSIEL